MARSPLVAASLLALVVTGGATGAAGADRSVRSPGAVTAVASSGATIAFASAPAGGDCYRVRIWSLAARTVTRLGARRACGDAVSTGRGIADVAVAGTRALWLEYVGGNIREWSLYTATRSAPRPRLLRFVTRDVDAPQPVVVGAGDPALLAYAVDDTVVLLRADGARASTWRAPARVTALATGDGKVAALLASGPVAILSRSGQSIAEYGYAPGTVKALRLARAGAIVQSVSGAVEVRTPTSIRRVPLPPTATVLDFAEGVVLYSLAGRVRGRHVASGDDALLRATGLPVRAALDPAGLVYARGRQVGFVPWREVAALLRAG